MSANGTYRTKSDPPERESALGTQSGHTQGSGLLRLFPIGLEPQSLIRCSEVEGIDRRWQSYCL
jgi:hypothetical protein